jgi:hypothetical protein
MKRTPHYQSALYFAVIVVAYLWVPTDAAGATIYVPDNFPTVQQGIDGAKAGDAVIVRDGTYLLTSALDFKGKAITVRSENGASSCFLDGQGLTRVVNFHSGEGSGSVLYGFTIQNGKDPYKGGGIFFSSSSPTISYCKILNNSAAPGQITQGGGLYLEASSPIISHCIISGSLASSSTVASSAAYNTAYSYGGAIYISGGSPSISDTTITGNNATGYSKYAGVNAYGGGIYVSGSSPKIADTTIVNNSVSASVDAKGGGIFLSASTPTIVNSVISGNTAKLGAGVYFDQSSAFSSLTNCTIARNTAATNGGALYFANTSPAIINSILWEDSPQEVSNEGTSNPAITYSDVYGGYSGTGNINASPAFVNISLQDFHLKLGSPCINSGSNAAPELPGTDKDGKPRVADAVVDMGVYEYPSASIPAALTITISKPSFINGDRVEASEFRLRNQGSAVACEIKVWLSVPGIDPISVLNLGSDGSLVVPAGTNQDFGPLTLFTVSDGLPRGNYEFSSRLIDPVRGSTISEDRNPFLIQ